MWRQRTLALKWEHVCTTGRYDVNDRHAHRRTIRCVMAHSKTRPARGEPMEREISIFQANQLGFSRSSGSSTSNEANKSAMRRAEWTITAPFGTNEMSIFCPSMLQAERNFFRCKPLSDQNRSYFDNISTNRQYLVGFQQGYCSR